jgi:AraC family transcriptional activator of tynA and feaB
MVVEICTDAVPLSERPDYWRQTRLNLFKDDCRIRPDPATPFQASISMMKLGPLTLSDCRGSSFRMVREKCNETGILELLIQTEGECVIRHDGHETLLSPGKFSVFPANSRAELEMRGDYRKLSLRFQSSLLSERYADWEHRAFTRIPCDSGAGGIFLGLVRAMMQYGESANSKICVEAFQAMLGLLATTLGEKAEEALRMPATRMVEYHKARIRNYVLENLANPELDVARISNALGLSQRYLHLLFTDEPMQLMHWIWNERLERCFKELARRSGNDRPVSTVAYSWGFNDASHFSRAFRKRYGASPRDIQSGFINVAACAREVR